MSKALALLEMQLDVLFDEVCQDCQKLPAMQKLKKKLQSDRKKWFKETFLTE